MTGDPINVVVATRKGFRVVAVRPRVKWAGQRTVDPSALRYHGTVYVRSHDEKWRGFQVYRRVGHVPNAIARSQVMP